MDFTFAIALNERSAPPGIEVWRLINDGPSIIRPKYANTFEPLRKVENINLEEVCSADFIWRNGRKCLGMFHPKGWGKATLSILLSYPEMQHSVVTGEVYQFLRQKFAYRLLYGVAPTEQLMKLNLAVHQLANCGAIPPNESILETNSTLFEFYENHI